MLQLRYIENLYALAAIPVMLLLFYFLLRWKKKASKKIGDPALVNQLIKGFSSGFFLAKFILFVIAFGLCAFAAADLVKPEGSQKIERKGIDVMIALDVSKSMLAEDIKPSRLERAKQVITRLIDKLSDDRIGIVVFAGKAYLQMPMTTDHSAAKMYLSSASPDDIPTQGTVISDALKMCYAAFNTKEKKYRAIILVTDGEDHDEDAIKVTKQLKDDGVMVNTVGIGSPQGAPIRDKETNDYKKDENGNTVISKLNEEELQSIAQNGDGLYQLFTNTEDVANNLHNKLATIGETTLVDSSFVNYKYYFGYLLLAALILLLIEFFIPERRKTQLLTAMITCFFLLSNGSVHAQNIQKELAKANEAYNKQQYKEAAQIYNKALSKAPTDPTAYFNLGNTMYRSDNPSDAVEAFDKTIESSHDNAIKEKAFYNKGVAWQKQNKLPECIQAYKNALKLDPNDEEARQNLERALKKDKENKQKQDKQDKKDNKDKDKDKKDKDDQKQQKQDEPKPEPSKISKEDAEEKLKALLEHEKDLQDKLHKVKAATSDKPKKDW